MKWFLIQTVVIMTILAGMVGAIFYAVSPTVYDFGNGTRLVVPCGAVSIDRREEGFGIVVQSGVNVTLYNDSDQWRTLTVSYRKPNYRILDAHAFEDLPPKSVKTFGVDYDRYEGMHVFVSEHAQEEREKDKET